MSELTRFGVSLDRELLEKFDLHIKEKHFHNRSNAISSLIRKELIKKEWQSTGEITGVLILVYDHHYRDLNSKLTDLQHKYHEHIISSQHIHLDNDNCFEIIIVKGKTELLYELLNRLKAQKGIKHSDLSLAISQKDLL